MPGVGARVGRSGLRAGRRNGEEKKRKGAGLTELDLVHKPVLV
jgi:hypothetical protein